MYLEQKWFIRYICLGTMVKNKEIRMEQAAHDHNVNPCAPSASLKHRGGKDRSQFTGRENGTRNDRYNHRQLNLHIGQLTYDDDKLSLHFDLEASSCLDKVYCPCSQFSLSLKRLSILSTLVHQEASHLPRTPAGTLHQAFWNMPPDNDMHPRMPQSLSSCHSPHSDYPPRHDRYENHSGPSAFPSSFETDADYETDDA